MSDLMVEMNLCVKVWKIKWYCNSIWFDFNGWAIVLFFALKFVAVVCDIF